MKKRVALTCTLFYLLNSTNPSEAYYCYSSLLHQIGKQHCCFHHRNNCHQSSFHFQHMPVPNIDRPDVDKKGKMNH